MIRNHSQGGFTMVELLIVMVIIGVMVTIAIPRFDYVFTKNKLRAGTTSVTSALYHSRMRAVNDGELHGVQFNTNGEYYVVSDPLGAPQVVGDANRLDTGVTFGANSFINRLVVFNSLGQLEKACLPTGQLSGEIVLYDDIGDSTNVMITFLTGRIRETIR